MPLAPIELRFAQICVILLGHFIWSTYNLVFNFNLHFILKNINIFVVLPWTLSKIITDKSRGFTCGTIPSTSRYSRYGRNQTVHMISKITSWKIKTYIYISMLWFWFHTIWRLIFLNAIPNFIYLVTYLQVSQRVYCVVDIIKSFNVKSSLKSCITKSPLLSFFANLKPNEILWEMK